MTQRNPEISKGIDWSLVWIYLALVVIGLLAIFAATYKEGDPVIQSFLQYKTDYSKQFYVFIISAVLAFFILLTDSKFFTVTANLWYLVGIIVLLLVFPLHSRIKGTESIIRLGGFQFQPAEFCKICVALALAKYLSRPETDFSKPRSQFIAASIVLFPAVLTIFQSETGLALVYFSFFLVMFREGLPSVILIIGFAIAVLVVATIVIEPNTLAILLTAIALATIYFLRRMIKRNRGILFTIITLWFVCVGIQRFAVPFAFKHVLQKYQVERIYSLFGKDNPYRKSGEIIDDAETKQKISGSSYNVRQSKIAIGSGQLWGKGLLKGTQTRYDFVPEQRTDFIFCTVGEGFGFAGSVVLLGIYLLLLFRIITVAERQRSVFSRCYAYGVAAVFFFHIVINIAMTVGLAPVIGITLPFISYGGTSLVTFTVLLFILIRLDADRQMVLR
ncbi:MAG: rod shape-determining protein RodA [Bacteroidetes bacterium]|nr:rod shape-determining protein RodA [Bacteroidota bacterium]MBS1631912.1 rod shape-determining protein RodA [Bacteroidota bacterium]